MNPPNLGSGNSLLGGQANEALSQAIARRATGQGGATQAVTPASANFDPSTVTPQPSAPPQATATPAQAPAPSPIDNTEAGIIIKSLTKRLADIGTVQKQGGQI